ncbi:recombinase family protein [Streptomyces sp. NPDC057877]|uniref:recombinase family protein n=1 Tax=Streptomyces sp. NPDC057877 TaxID=3346269 RepID=UPI0036888161
MEVSKPKKAGIYCRLSYAPDGSLEKVERQEADCRELAARMGWTVSDAHVFPDNSRSAWQRNRKRPQWDAMLKAIEAGEIDGIIVYHGDRLIRQPFDLEKLISIAESKRLRIASPSGTRDLDSADDRYILRIEAAGFCRESDSISRRVTRGVESRVAKGLPGTAGGKRPYGWGVQTGTREKTDRATGETVTVPVFDTTQPVPEEIRFIQRGAERMLAGMNQSAVVRWLNSQGARTTEGNPWTAKSWRNVMLNPRTAGYIERDGKLFPAQWDGAITLETWEAVKGLYRDNAKQHPYRGRERAHLLTGIAECYQCHKPKPGAAAAQAARCAGADCGGPHQTVRSKPSGGRNRKHVRLYYCPECRGIGRNLALLDAYVEGKVLKLLSSPRFAAELQRAVEDESGTGLQAQITALERRRHKTAAELEDLAEHPDVDPTLSMLAVASFDRKIAELRAQMATSAKLRRITRVMGMSREEWADEPVDVRATVVRDLYRVVILPTSWRGPGFDPSSVRLERHPLSQTGRDDGTGTGSRPVSGAGPNVSAP